MNLLAIFEHLCFDELSKNLQRDFLIEIPEDIKKKIKNKLINNYDNKLFTIKDLGAAVRRYISRYLVGLTQRTEVDNARKLEIELTRRELWRSNITNNDNYEEVIINHLKEFELNVGEAFDFYELIGNEDKNEIKFLEEN